MFKGSSPSKYAYATELGMVTACIVGNVMNIGRNSIAAINTEGWLYLLDMPKGEHKSPQSDMNDDMKDLSERTVQPDVGCQTFIQDGEKISTTHRLRLVYDQRMPANCKELLLADLDGDGQNELIVGLTDRVLRTYKWIRIGQGRGKFVGLYKWEFADQIGAVSLNPSRHENCQDIIVAQPGGTYAKLECFDKKPLALISNSTSSSSSSGSDKKAQNQTSDNLTGEQYGTAATSGESPLNRGDNVKTEYISKLTPEYHQLALAQMRNHHVSTEVLGGIRDSKGSDSYSSVVIATLDGTLMLVNRDEILWSLQVDHQLFAAAVIETGIRSKSVCIQTLTPSESSSTIVPNPRSSKAETISSLKHDVATQDKLDSSQEADSTVAVDSTLEAGEKSITGSKTTCTSSQYFAVCAWNGKTYIIDEERNYLRFKFEEAVSAFTSGNYHFNGCHHPSLVYATFNNQIVLYYDVILDEIRPMYLLKELKDNPEYAEVYGQLVSLAQHLELVGSCQASDSFEAGMCKTANSLSGCSLNTLNKDDTEDAPGTPKLGGRPSTTDIKLASLLKEILYNIKSCEMALE